MDLASISKAIAGGVAGLLIAELARFGWSADDVQKNAINVLVTAVVGYVVGHVVVYLAPRNRA